MSCCSLLKRSLALPVLTLLVVFPVEAFMTSPNEIANPIRAFEECDVPKADASCLESRCPGWHATWNAASGTIHRAFGPSVHLTFAEGLTDANVERTARRFIQSNPEIFKISDRDLTLVRAEKKAGKWFVIFERRFRGVKVWDGRVDLRLMGDGRLLILGADTYPGVDIDVVPALSVQNALQGIIQATGSSPAAARMKASELVIFPKKNGAGEDFSLAWHVEVWTDAPLAHYNGIVDANTGEILLLIDEIRYGVISGDVYGSIHPQHRSDPSVKLPFRHELVEALGTGGGSAVTDTLGHFDITVSGMGKRLVKAELKGDYVRVTNASGPRGLFSDSLTPGIDGQILWDNLISIPSERDGFFHTNVAHDYIKIIDPGFTLLDYAMPCEMNIQNLSNAYWDGYGMHFGAGGNDFGQHADVIYHEYGHGITDFQYRPWGPSGGMHEGFSDFYAATITNDSKIGEGVMGYRDLNNNLRSPENLQGESHADGMIIGGALWHMRVNLNDVPLAESLFHYARYGLPGSPSQPEPQNFLDYLVEVYVVDDDDGDLTNGTPHAAEIAPAFSRHGIGPSLVLDSVEVKDCTGQPDMFLDPGDTVKIVNWVKFTQPIGIDADSVDATISCPDPSIELMKGNALFEKVPANSTGDNASDPFLFVVSDSLDRVVDATFTVELSGNPIFFQKSYKFVVRVGRPQILLVDDDGGAPYEMFFESSLDSIGMKPYHWDVKLLAVPDSGILAKFPAVIWFTGDCRTGTLTDLDILRLSQYLDNGGRLLLTGQNIGEDISSKPFYSNYLKAKYLAPRSLDHVVEGASWDLIGQGLTVITGGSGGGSNQTSQDIIDALSGADTVFMYDDGVGAIRYDSGIFKTAYFAFGLEGVNDFAKHYDHRPIILKRILLWFGLNVGCDEECEARIEQPGRARLFQNSPNPFSVSTSFTVFLPGRSLPKAAGLEVYDASGRRVKSFDVAGRMQGEQRFFWDGRDDEGRKVSAGVYFCRLSAGDFTDAVKMVKVK
jgi:hypothetical protein